MVRRAIDELEKALDEARQLNARVQEHRAALLVRERELADELEQVREALAALPMPRESMPTTGETEDLHRWGLSVMSDPDYIAIASASDLIRIAIATAASPLSARAIHERIQSLGKPLSYGVVNTTLSRLHARGELVSTGDRGERQYYLSPGAIRREPRQLAGGFRVHSGLSTDLSPYVMEVLNRKSR